MKKPAGMLVRDNQMFHSMTADWPLSSGVFLWVCVCGGTGESEDEQLNLLSGVGGVSLSSLPGSCGARLRPQRF